MVDQSAEPGEDPARWRSTSATRTVVVVARNMTSTVWLLDVLPELLADVRIRYRRSDPRVRCVVVGDPVLDRLQASRPRRDEYRDRLGGGDHKLVTISSTWGPTGLFARQPELAAQLLGALPADEYVVASILHPNIWTRHGAWQTRLWLRDALDAGLRLLSPIDSWRAGLLASDLLIGDQGSVTMIGAASASGERRRREVRPPRDVAPCGRFNAQHAGRPRPPS